jgi:hypothetical protein
LDSDGEVDELGQDKINRDGELLGGLCVYAPLMTRVGRQYNLTTFILPDRHPRKRWMISRDPAVHLGFRDSYVFYMRNPEFKKIRATEQDRMYMQSIGCLPHTLKKRDVFLVSAKSVYKKFGHRVVLNGRIKRDDYFESRVTEQDEANEAASMLTRTAATHRKNNVDTRYDPTAILPRLAAQKHAKLNIPLEQSLLYAAQSALDYNRQLMIERKRHKDDVDVHTQTAMHPVKKQQLLVQGMQQPTQFPLAVMKGQDVDAVATWTFVQPPHERERIVPYPPPLEALVTVYQVPVPAAPIGQTGIYHQTPYTRKTLR